MPPNARVVLCVGAIRPHKNQAVLVRALPRLPEDVVVILAGHPEPYVADLEALATELGVTERLRIAGYVDDADMEALWRLAGAPRSDARRGVRPAGRGGARPRRSRRVFRPRRAARGRRRSSALLPSGRRGGRRTGRDGGVERPRDDPAAKAWAARFSWEAAAHGTFEAYERALA